MDTGPARMILARLASHWPTIGGESHDPAAAARVHDWLRVIERSTSEAGSDIATRIVEGWTENRAPKPADWLELARQRAYHDNLNTKAIEAPKGPMVPPERAESLFEQARSALTAGMARRRPERELPPRPERSPSQAIAPGHHVLTYDEAFPQEAQGE